ncbi:MAG: S-layer homology domain-containing protein [Anaerolineales bacterium]|nr:S-layer homology domain-containing protein [Anaerolineales bacterium]
MKQKSLILISVLAVMLAVTAFVVGKASASTGCFNDTNGHWAETFICWLKDNSISSGYADGGYHPDSYITRAEMAVMLKNQAEVSPSTGVFYTNAGPSQWQSHTFSPNGNIELFTIRARLGSSLAGIQDEYFVLNPTLPATTYGRQMYLDGVKICYDANNTSGKLSYVELGHYSGGSTPALYNNLIDATIRSDAGCRTYSLANTGSIYGSDIIFLYIGIDTTGTSDYVEIFNVSFITHVGSAAGILSLDDEDSRLPIPGSSPSPIDGSGNP